MRAITLLLILATLARAQIPVFDAPVPEPVNVFNVKSVCGKNAPVEMTGTAGVYVMPLPKDEIATWVYEGGLVVRNVSNKIITQMTVEVVGRGIYGDPFTSLWKLDFVDPQWGPPEPLNPGETWRPLYSSPPTTYGTMPAEKTIRSAKNLRVVTPNAKVRVTSVTFNDGTKYEEPSLISK